MIAISAATPSSHHLMARVGAACCAGMLVIKAALD
jgi:hypothetical protein